MLFSPMKQNCASTATELIEFFEEMEQDILKKTQKIWVRTNDRLSDKYHLCFVVQKQSDGRKLLVKCPHKLNPLGYL